MYCSQCSAWYPPTAQFCDVCGRALAANPSSASASLPIPQTNTTADDLKGLRGWLIVVGFGLVVSLVLRLYSIFQNVTALTGGDLRILSHIPGYVPLLKFELVASLAFLVAILFAAILFFHESRSFPRFYISLLIARAIFMALDHTLFAHVVAHASDQVRQSLTGTVQANGSRDLLSAAAALLWILYVLKSERVKATFVK